MSGVALVGFSGSLIKDVVKDSPISGYLPSILGGSGADLPLPGPIEEPEVTTVLVGEFCVRPLTPFR